MDEQSANPHASVVSVKRNLYRGSLAALLRVALAIPVYIILTPFTLRYLHTEQFAIWSFSATIIGIINLADLGFKSSLLYHCANNLHDQQYIKKLFGTAVFLYLCFWLLTVLVTILCLSQIVRVLGIPVAMATQGQFVVLMTVLSFGLRFVAIPYQALIEAHHGVGYSQTVLLAWLIVNAVATLLLLPLFPNLYIMGWIALCSSAIVFTCFYVRVRKLFPLLRSGTVRYHSRAARDLVGYGAGVYVATVMIGLREPLFKLFLSHDYGLAAVADFEIAFRFCTQIISAVISPLLGTFAAAAILSKRPEELVNVLRPMFGFTLLTLPPIALFIFCFSDWLIPFWIKTASSGVIQLLPWMFAAFALYYMTEVLYQALLGAGWSNYSAVVQCVVLSVCAAVLFLLHSTHHATAVGVSILAGFACFSLINAACFRYKFNAKLFPLITVLKFALPSALMLVAAIVFQGQHMLLLILYSIHLTLHVVVASILGMASPAGLWQRMRDSLPSVNRMKAAQL